jgi:signal transduction histidine kinase
VELLGRFRFRPADSAVANTQRLKVVALALTRLGGLLNVTAAIAVGWNKGGATVGLLEALAAIVAVESAVLVGACWRAGRLVPAYITADVVFDGVGLIANRLIERDSNLHTWAGFFMYPYTIVTALVIGIAYRHFLAVFAATWVVAGSYVYTAVAIAHDPVWNTVPNVASYLLTTPVAWAVTRAFDRSAEELDASRAVAELRSAELAREKERARHARLLHDRVLQTLEMLAQGQWVSDDEVHQHIRGEAAWLRALVEGGEAAVPDDLVSALHDVVVQKTRDGLRINFTSAGLGEPGSRYRRLPAPLIEALAGAAYEALTNVHKHSGVRSATVWAGVENDGIAVSVVDAGRGFDPTRPTAGFGLARSIRARVEDVGGRLTLDSAPNEGTQLQAWVPLPDEPGGG